MKKLLWSLAGLWVVGWGQDPRTALELFRLGRYSEAYPLFKRLFERERDYLWATYATDCLLQEGKTAEWNRWVQEERRVSRTSPWATAWEIRAAFLRGDTSASTAWAKLVARPDLPLFVLEALAEVAWRVWGRPDWQRAALLSARNQNPHAYAPLLITTYELENRWAAAWTEWVQHAHYQKLPLDTLLFVWRRYRAAGMPPDSAELPLLQLWQQAPSAPAAELLSRFYLSEGDLMEALRYARAALRLGQTCETLYEVAWNAAEKGFFTTASEAFRLLLQTGEKCPYFSLALSRYLEIEALQTRPQQVLQLLDSLLGRHPDHPALQLERARWLLRLHQADSAWVLLERLTPPTPSLLAQKYLLLSQAALQKDDFAQARLALLELESRLPQSTWLSEAYFALGKLAYFQGEFELAKTRLRLLKNNTQDDLANDAIQLFWHIEDNLKPDTLTEPLRLFARAELYRFQGKAQAAQKLLDSLEKTYKGHPITDDVLWQKAQQSLDQGDTTQARVYLQLLADYPDSESLYRDDALYLLGGLARRPAEAAEYYERLLREVPGSLYSRLAQEKLRALAR